MSTPPLPSISTPLSMTHHAPMGAWASLFFGNVSEGARIEHEELGSAANASLVLGVQRDGVMRVMPFVDAAGFEGCEVLGGAAVRRTLSPCVDEYVCKELGLTLRVFSPNAALPNPKRSSSLQYATAPGVLVEVIFDNTKSAADATVYLGIDYRGAGKLRPVDWSSKALCGVGESGKWLLAANAVKGEVFTVQADHVTEKLSGAATSIDANSQRGGIAIKVPAGGQKTISAVLTFFHHGAATQGIEGRYLYSAYFARAEMAANFILQNAQKIRESCSAFEARATAACPDEEKLAVLSHGVRTYAAATQLIDVEGAAYFTFIDGVGHRNPLAATVDHLPWELFRNPWIVRNVFDLATTSYSYRDQIRFAGDETPREGGLTFADDFGLATTYASAGNWGGIGSGGMATEQLLNGIYMLTSYALLADDTPWAKTRLPFARDLLVSMENRDHWDPEQRTGVLKAESDRAGADGERTVFGRLGKELGGVPGNLYVTLKTFCANLLLTTYFQNNNDLHSADYSYAFAQKTAQALVVGADAESGILRANLLSNESAGVRFIGALEALALPTYLGLTTTLEEYFPELFACLKSHALACLKPGPEGCIDISTGSLRMASGSTVMMPGKAINVLYVLERLFQIDVRKDHPGTWAEIIRLAEMGEERRGGAGESLLAAALFVRPVVG